MLSFFKPKLTKRTLKVGKRKKGLLFFNPSPFRVLVFSIATGVVLTSTAYLLFLLFPLTAAYLNYRFGPKDQFKPPVAKGLPVEKINYDDFYIDIPKIKANAQVTPNVPINNKADYLEALKKGVAQATGSGFPGEGKSIFLFAHSTDSPYNFVRYNAVFMLLNNLQNRDEIFLFFSGRTYIYQVYDKQIVSADRTDFINYPVTKETLILQTCWPPGTTWNRLLVFAHSEI